MTLSLADKIRELAGKRDAVILAHNYALPEVQDVADLVGDSLDLSRKAAETPAKVIVFCGVHFMAETASILSPTKTVLMPDPEAGCPMADMAPAQKVREMKRIHPGAVVIGYVNTTAETKAECDLCCTSANASDIVNAVGTGQKIIFLPDRHLGDFVSRTTKLDMILWDGFCPTHARILPEHIEAQRRKHPKALVLAHPECSREVVDSAAAVLSTNGMVRFAKTSQSNEFIVGTENGIIHRLQKENPGKSFYPASELAVCPNMKLNSLEKILWCLEGMKNVVKVSDELRLKAARPVERMLSLSK